MKFCDILRELLEDNDVTQKQLARDLNIASTTMGNYVRGVREPDFEILKLLAAYFNVSTDYLLDFQNEDTQCHSEDELLRIFRSLEKEYQELFLAQGKLLIRHSSKDDELPLASDSQNLDI